MNGESEALQRTFLKLLQELIPNASPADAEAIRQGLESGKVPDDDSSGVPHDSFTPQVQQLRANDPTISISASCDSEAFSNQRKSSHDLGELPAVQDRFHALLKRRLEAEIQLNPPLFPWEAELHDYDASDAGFAHAAYAAEAPVPVSRSRVPAGLWLSQLQSFNLPVALPDAVLAKLFRRCQTAIRSSMREGTKLVHAVEELFPEREQVLNYLAGLVLTAPARSPATAPADAHSLQNYEAAEPAQQMVLSLLAAREILAALTLAVAPQQPVEREWLTDLGALRLTVSYHPEQSNRLRVEGHLPMGGALLLRGEAVEASAHRENAGFLSVELGDVAIAESYELEVALTDMQEAPLVFAIKLS